MGVFYMAVLEYSLKAAGAAYPLSPNFKLREFACQDGSDKVLVDTALVGLLQQIRAHFGVPVTINSGYRTVPHNKKVGGSPKSQHLYGKAADIVVQGIKPVEVARYAETRDAGGIGLYNWGVHVDTRDGRSRWDSTSGRELAVAGFYALEAPQPPAVPALENRKIYVDGLPRLIRAMLVGGENYVNLREIVTALGGAVNYDASTRRIDVDSQENIG